MRFGHGRKTRNGKNSISATAEAEKMPQKRFSNPLEMGEKLQKRLSNLLEARKADASTEFT